MKPGVVFWAPVARYNPAAMLQHRLRDKAAQVLSGCFSQRDLIIRNPGPPRLLVSVRNVAEAEAALAGGCDVLDLKEPGRGAMGMADISTIEAVLERTRTLDCALP